MGTKVYSFHDGKLQFKELYTVRGFQASSEPIIHFGYGKHQKVDSLKVVWPDKTFQVLKNISTNQTLEIGPENVKPFDYESLKPRKQKLFKKVEDRLGIDFTHHEDNYTDFNRQKLIPYQLSDRGPATAVGDLNDDGKDDLFFGGSKYFPSKVYLNNDTIYSEKKISSIAKDSINEEVSAVIADLNGDAKNDLFLGTGGADFFDKLKPLVDTYYVQGDPIFERQLLPKAYENASVVKANDFDGDGDLDLFVGNQVITNDFGKNPHSYILLNDDGNFSIQENGELKSIGMVTDAIWHDFNKDGQSDLIVIGEWMSPKFFKNENGKLKKTDLIDRRLNGLWQCILPFDIDQDGDEDYILGNWGTNSKFKSSPDNPMRLYYDDFDKNGQTETITALEKNGEYYPIEGLDGLSSQIVSLRKKFNSYSDFAGKSIDEVFDNEVLNKVAILEVHELQSGYLKNESGNFSFIPFGEELQIAPIMAFLKYDFDKDGKEEVLAAGNYFGVKPYHGRFGSFLGALIKGENEVILGNKIGLDFYQKSVRHLNIINLNKRSYLLATIHNDSTQVYSFDQNKKY